MLRDGNIEATPTAQLWETDCVCGFEHFQVQNAFTLQENKENKPTYIIALFYKTALV